MANRGTMRHFGEKIKKQAKKQLSSPLQRKQRSSKEKLLRRISFTFEECNKPLPLGFAALVSGNEIPGCFTF